MEQENFQLIESYLLDAMSNNEKEIFEQRLREDSDLKQEFEIMKSIVQSAEMSAKEKMKIDFEEIHKKNFQAPKSKNGKVIRIHPIYKRAAIVLLLIGMSLTIWVLSTQKSAIPQDQLYATYFEPTDLALNYRGDESNETLEILQELFNTKDYNGYLTQLEQTDLGEVDLPALSLAKGQAHLELNQFTQAEEEFKSLLSNPLYEDQVKWYLGLTYIKQGENSEALTYLNAISNENKYGKLAKEMIGNLK